jgi:hypothetical protein
MEITEKISFPRVSGSNLNGSRFNLPQDLTGDLKIVLIAFKRNQVSLLETWAPAMEEIEKNHQVTYYELPTLSRNYAPLGWWIDGGMRAGIIDEKARDKTITLYINKQKFKQQLKIPTEDIIYVFLLNKAGQPIWRTEGALTEEKLKKLETKIINAKTASESHSP